MPRAIAGLLASMKEDHLRAKAGLDARSAAADMPRAGGRPADRRSLMSEDI